MLRVSEPESDMENNTKDTPISAPSPDICAKVSFKFYYIYTCNLVNVLKFGTHFFFYSQIKCWFQGWNSQEACQNSKQGRP